ncbi:MAG: xanthine dehydrogenase family protein subunit M [Desulfatiglandales bacterium]|nr:xanthine dehydrogenase family protein subunit M [Desulfatiglandales bacterium]
MRVLKSFEYFEPRTVEEAVGLLSRHDEKAKVLAGGVDLIPRMRQRKIQPEYMVNIQRIGELDYIEGDGTKGLRIGALTTLRSIERSPIINKNYRVLYDAVHQITSVQAKTMGTAVGNLCVASPASDIATVLVALGSELRVNGTAGERTIPIENFFIGPGQSALKPGEMVREISLPGLPQGTLSAFLNLVRTKSDIAKVSVATAITVSDDTCREARVALGAVAPTVFRATKAETVLKGQKFKPEVIEAAADAVCEETRTISDLRSTAEYRKEMTRVLVKRALESAKA